MELRKRVSNRLGDLLRPAYQKRLHKGTIWSVPYETWRRIPKRAHHWLNRQLLSPGALSAHSFLRNDHALSKLELPNDNHWVLSASAVLAIYRYLHQARPDSIIEFGSGYSTALFAIYASESNQVGGQPVKVVSVEHDEQCLRVTRDRLTRLGLMHLVDLVHAPLVPIGPDNSQLTYNVPDRIRNQGRFSFCLVDGPPAAVGRGPVLGLISGSLKSGATVILDDGFRDAEQAVWESWQRQYPSHLKRIRMLLTDRGMILGHWLDRKTSEN